MKRIIDIPEEQFKTVNFIAHNAQHWRDRLTLEQIIATGEPYDDKEDKYIKEIDHLRKYISKLETQIVEQKPYDEDCISRKAVLDTLDNMDKALDEDRTVENYKELLRECYKVLTPVNPNKTGYWIKEKSRYGWDGKSYVCSECGRSIHLDSDVEDLRDYPYCHCGAQMTESEE